MRRAKLLLPVVILPTFVYSLFRFSTGVIIPDLERHFGIADPVAGLIVSASVASVTVGVISSGYFTSRYGETRTIVAGIALFSIAFVALVASSSLAVFAFLFLAGSYGGGVMTTPTYSLAVSILSERRGTAISLVTSSFNIGGLLGPILVGYMLAFYGWPSPFTVLGVGGAVLFALFFVTRGRIARYEARRNGTRGSFREIARKRSLLILAFANLFADLGFVSYASWIPKFLISTYSASSDAAAFIDSVFGISIGLGGIGILIAGWLFDRVGGRKASLLGGLATSLLALLLFLGHSFIVAVGLVIAIGFVLNWFWTLLTAMAQANASEDQRSLAISFVQTGGFIGAFIGPGLAGLLGGQSGVSSFSLIATVVLPYLVYALIVLVSYRDPPRNRL